MSSGTLFRIDGDGWRRPVFTYRNAHAGFSLIWEVLLQTFGVEAGRDPETALFLRIKQPDIPRWAKLAFVASNFWSWIHRDHLVEVAEAFLEVSRRMPPPLPKAPSGIQWFATPDIEDNVLPKLAAALKEIAADPSALGAHVYWYSVMGDPAKRHVRLGGLSGIGFHTPESAEPGEEVWDRVECDFRDPISRHAHGLIEVFDELVDFEVGN